MNAPSWIEPGPALVLFLFCFAVTPRAQGTYWLGRAVAAGLIKADGRGGIIGRLSKWLNGPTPKKGAAILNSWGIIVIPLCFMTVGLQTAVLAGAGLVRMSWIRFTLAMLPGAIAWSLLYGLAALAVWAAAISAVAGSPWTLAAIAALIAIAAIIYFAKKASTKKMAAMEAAILDESAA